MLSELITPELMAEYKQILKSFNDKTKKSEEHSQREFIDINDKELSDNIEGWIENLVDEVKSKKKQVLMKMTPKNCVLNAGCFLIQLVV